MPGVQILKVLIAVAVSGALKETAQTAQVKIKKTIRNISAKDILGAVHGILNWASVMLVTRVLLSRERSVV